jgi:hypothetical protein
MLLAAMLQGLMTFEVLAQSEPPATGSTGSSGGGTTSTPPLSAEELNNLLHALGNAAKLGSDSGSQIGAGDIADALKDLDPARIGQMIGALQDPATGGITGIAGQIDIDALGNVAEGFSNNIINKGLMGAFKSLEDRYNSGTLTPQQQQLVYKQMQALQFALQNYGSIKDLTGLAHKGVGDILEKAGLSNLVGSMGDLLKGGFKDPQDLAKRLADVDWNKLSEAMAYLGIPGPEALAKFLPPGTDPKLLGEIFNAYKNGGLEGLVDTLIKKLKDELISGIKNSQEVQAALDKLEQWKQNLKNKAGGFLGGLFNGLFKKKGKGQVSYKADCKKLFKDMAAYDAYELPAELVYECTLRGYDPPKALRARGGTGETANTITSSTEQVGGCKANGECQNSSIERTETFATGYLPQNNPNLKFPEIPWQDIGKSNLPCGAIGSLSEMAIQAIWRNVKIKMPSMVQQLVNSAIRGLLGNLFGKKVDCQDGTFWGTLNTVIGLVLPQLQQGGGFVYDISNNTFLAPKGALLSLPGGANLQVDLSQGNVSFSLPAGGSFTDINGNTVTIPSNGTIHFGSSGTVNANGQSYKVDPDAIVDLNANGVVAIPEGTALPVPPDSPLMPMGPVTTPPDWSGVAPSGG